MLDNMFRDKDIKRAIDDCLPGLENNPDFEWKVLREVRGEEKVKKKLSAGFILVLALVLTAVTALATYFLSARQIVQEEVLPIAIKNDEASHQEEFSNEELATIIKLAQENNIELSDSMINALEGGYGYSEQSAIMALASSEFGTYMEWTIEQQYWFSEVMVAIGWEETNNCRLPQNDEITFEQALRIVEGYIAKTYDEDLSDGDKWKYYVKYRLYAESAQSSRWFFAFEPTTPKPSRYDLILESDGTLVSCEEYQGISDSGMDIMDLYHDAYGVHNLWTPEIWVEYSKSIASAVPDNRQTWAFQHTEYILPPEGGVDQSKAEEVALAAVDLDYTTAGSVVCCMDGDTPIWKVVTYTMYPEDIGSATYSAIWLIEIDALTGEVRGQREYKAGDKENLTQWIPWSVYENLPERPEVLEN
ncbi:MAG: hypothetical protein GX096_09310 [Clostridiales bacterium]|nr:hypothetical protein [Clostridiales bacterium]